MFNDYTFPMSLSSAPIITFIPTSRFDDRGRQMPLVESDVQRQERLSFLKATKAGKGWSSLSESSSGRSSPTSSINSSTFSGSPTNSPYSDILDITNTYPEPFLFYSSPLPSASSPTSLFSAPAASASSSTFKRSHRRQSSSMTGLGLHAIPEED